MANKIETLAEAIAVAEPYGAALWEGAGHAGTYRIRPEGYEDEAKFLILDGAAEEDEDPEAWTPLDKVCLFVMKADGLVVEADGLEASRLLEDMSPTQANN